MSASDWTMTHREYDEPAAPGFKSGCPGTFTIIENEPPDPAWAACNECGMLTSVPQSMLHPATAELVPLREWSF
jgi:hypothetical protein